MKTKQDYLEKRQKWYLALSYIWWVWPVSSTTVLFMALLVSNPFHSHICCWPAYIIGSITIGLLFSLALLLNDRFMFGRIREKKSKIEKMEKQMSEEETLYKQNTGKKSPKDFDPYEETRLKNIRKIRTKIAKKQAYLTMVGGY